MSHGYKLHGVFSKYIMKIEANRNRGYRLHGIFLRYIEIYELTMLLFMQIVSTDLFDHFQNPTENHIPLSSNSVGFGSAYIKNTTPRLEAINSHQARNVLVKVKALYFRCWEDSSPRYSSEVQTPQFEGDVPGYGVNTTS